MDSPKGFEIPRHTQIPNSFLDDTLPQITSIGELKVLLAIMRQTFGWRKFTDTISMSQLVKLTGLTRQGVNNGLKLALTHGYIDRKPAGQSFSYGLKLVKQIDQSSNLTSQEGRPEVVKKVDRQLVKEIDPQKKGKEKKEKQTHPSFARLMDKHAQRVKHVPDGAAQGAALKWLLERYSETELVDCYRAQMREEWRKGRVSWLTVKKDIGSWLATKTSGNGRAPGMTLADIQQMKEAQ